MAIPRTTLTLLGKLEHTKWRSPKDLDIYAVMNLAVFIDTHRDQPHVGSFHEDIHRGECRPTLVHAALVTEPDSQTVPYLVEPATGKMLRLHPKHLFVTPEWYETWFVNWIMEHGTGPLDEEGKMPTSHFRDPREKIYTLKTFGYVVRARADKEDIR